MVCSSLGTSGSLRAILGVRTSAAGLTAISPSRRQYSRHPRSAEILRRMETRSRSAGIERAHPLADQQHIDLRRRGRPCRLAPGSRGTARDRTGSCAACGRRRSGGAVRRGIRPCGAQVRRQRGAAWASPADLANDSPRYSSMASIARRQTSAWRARGGRGAACVSTPPRARAAGRRRCWRVGNALRRRGSDSA